MIRKYQSVNQFPLNEMGKLKYLAGYTATVTDQVHKLIGFLRMIVVHELAHLREKQHNKAFYLQN